MLEEITSFSVVMISTVVQLYSNTFSGVAHHDLTSTTPPESGKFRRLQTDDDTTRGDLKLDT